MPRSDERRRLIEYICDMVRVNVPSQRMDDFFKMRVRIEKTQIEVLRDIADEIAIRLATNSELVDIAAACELGYMR